MRRFEGKGVVITGADRGIGFAIAERFCQEGANVVAASIDEGVFSAAERLAAHGTKVVPVTCDVSDLEAVNGLYGCAETELGSVDISVQNAGIITIAKVEDLTEPRPCLLRRAARPPLRGCRP